MYGGELSWMSPECQEVVTNCNKDNGLIERHNIRQELLATEPKDQTK